MSSTFSALKNSKYRTYFFGQLISMSGTWMQSVAQSWLVYRLGGNGSWLGIISFVSQFPGILTLPFAGIAADTIDRRKLLIAIQFAAAAEALALAALTLTGMVQIWHIAVLGLFQGCIASFELTVRHTFAIDLVGREDLGSAITMNSVLINGSRITGPAIAGLVISQVGEGGCFLVNGISYFFVIAGLFFIKTPKPITKKSDKNFVRQFLESTSYVHKHKEIRFMMGAALFMSFLCFTQIVLMPMFTKDFLKGDAALLSSLTVAYGTGALVGTLFLRIPNNLRTGKEVVVRNLLLIGFSSMGFAFSQRADLSMALLFLLGFFTMRSFPIINNTIQGLVRDELRGRVMALYTMTFLGAMPVGNLLAGQLSDGYGADKVTFGAGVLICAAAIFLMALARREKSSPRLPTTPEVMFD